MLGTYLEPAPAGKPQFNTCRTRGPGEQALEDHLGKAALFLGKAKLGDADFLHGDASSHHFLKGFLYLNVSCKVDLLLNPLSSGEINTIKM